MEEANRELGEPLTDQLATAAMGSGREVQVDHTWVGVRDSRMCLPAHGWKIHISARPATLQATVQRVLPLLLDRTCEFKVVRDRGVLREINSGSSTGTVGKAVTVYPPPDAVVDTAAELAAVLVGFAGPRVLSDRRVRADAPVYYRYGPFVPQLSATEDGELELVMTGPDGATFPGAAGAEYRPPPWAVDPFQGARPAFDPDEGQAGAGHAAILGDRYRVVSGIMRSPNGNVYRCLDSRTGQPVVVKEARAYVGETPDGRDARTSLRNERRTLTALAGVPGTAQLVDHFRHDADEYLVTTCVGDRDLGRDVETAGIYTDDASPSGTPARTRSLPDLAAALVTLLDAVHQRGVVVRDLTPKNVVLDGEGRCHLVDFGSSTIENGEKPDQGWTPGYAPPDRNDDRPAEAADDYYALGATLLYAATGMHPLVIDPRPERNRERTLALLAGMHPPSRGGTCALIPRLLSDDAEQRGAAADDVRVGRQPSAVRPATARRASPQRVGTDLLDEVIEHTLAECARQARNMMDGSGDRYGPPAANVYRGGAGIGMELLQHVTDRRTREVTRDLAHWVAQEPPAPTYATMPRGLYSGSTGVDVFVAAAREVLDDPDIGPPRNRATLPDTRVRDDYTHGLAGIGTGHLLLAGLDGVPQHLSVAAECARRLLAGETLGGAGEASPPSARSALAESHLSFAHGSAGTTYFLLAYGSATGDQSAEGWVDATLDVLASEVARLVPAMARPAAAPMSASWCRGMAGIGTTLLWAAGCRDEGRYLPTARDAAGACLTMAPRMPVVSQCCGLAGVGELAIDTALTTGDEEFWDGAEQIAALILSRCGGDISCPLIPDDTLGSTSGSWGRGSSGVLSFLRRLRHRGGRRLWLSEHLPRYGHAGARLQATARDRTQPGQAQLGQ